ncbi:hypothetical protein EDL99_04100 [Ornithobacterium rhinotracheale]|uniref:hypothetical protein n=1 Tax=Ornithobacterium rhinotracheale TaxID=28251 RepID=UPI00129CFEEE|nr:hypothetical protein [Ornithobacterium rhinotracheale]MRJ08070.1 hypothetical protein [Ornithobacterium rhinotracheale]UOH78422.1 hypothetical protein MT996_02885 [Ornithobacterium rhinotracheale]
MAYNNGYSNGWGGNPNPNFNRGYNRGYNNQRPQKKHSGAKAGTTKKGGIYVTAWNYSKQKGMITVKAFENSRSVRSESQTGNRFLMMMFEVFYKNTGAKVLELANYNVNTGKVYLQKVGMVISTKAPNGGYFGQIKSR